MKRETAANRVMNYLELNRGIGYTNRDLANVLTIPVDSVRRIINELRAAGLVVADNMTPTVGRAYWMAA